jgi:hypothetical protein
VPTPPPPLRAQAGTLPPLTSEQIDRIVAILRLSDGDDTQLQHIA